MNKISCHREEKSLKNSPHKKFYNRALTHTKIPMAHTLKYRMVVTQRKGDRSELERPWQGLDWC
jgi:hypothetical protein